MDREPPDAASTTDRRALEAEAVAAVRDFLSRLGCRFHPVDALVFGSRARGDHRVDSDIDVAVILEGPPGDRYATLRDLSDIAYDVLLETSLYIQPLPLWAVEFERPDLFANPGLIRRIKREGLRP